MRAATLAAAAALAALGSATWAQATMPALPCGFECQWPMGSHSEIPAGIEVGVPFQVSVWYAWEDVPGNPAIGTAAGRTPPEGYYAWPAGLGPPAPPGGYAGSEVAIRLPEEIEMLGYGPELERRLLWIDGNGRSTYEYTGTLPYRPGSGPQSLLLTFVLNSPVAYGDTEIHADLGLSVRDAAPPVWIINNAGAGRATVSTEPAEPDPPAIRSFAEELREVTESPSPTPSAVAWAAAARAAGGAGAGGAGGAGAAGGALVPELRHTYVYPPPVVTPIPESEIPEEARRPGAGGANAEDQVIVYGQLHVAGRGGSAVPAANAAVCIYDADSANRLTIITHTGVQACRIIGSNGSFMVTVPSADPDGTGRPDIVVRFFSTNNVASVLNVNSMGSGPPYSYDLARRDDVPAGPLNLGMVVIPNTHPFGLAHTALLEVTEAHEFFESEFGYDVPRVLVAFSRDGRAYYLPSTEAIFLAGPPSTLSGRHTVLHEYGHHVHNAVYGQNRLPLSAHCSPHYFSVPSSASCAWTEGWANFVPSLVDGSPIVARTAFQTWDIESGQVAISGIPTDFGHGDAVEGRISSLLWDLHDSLPERGDTVQGGAQMIWDSLRGSTEASSELPAADIHEFREDWEARGYPGLGEAFALNTIPSRPKLPASLTAHVEDAGSPKSGYGARHASLGQSVVVTLGLAAPAAAAPTASFFGEAPSPMSAVGGGGLLWRSAHAVTTSTPEGTAVFRVVAAGTEYTPASITSGGNVSVDTTPLAAPTVEFTGSRSAVLEFGEPPLPESVSSSAFAVTSAAGTSPQVAALHVPGSPRVVLDLGAAVGAGAHTIAVPATLRDVAGNTHAGSMLTANSAHASAAAPSFSIVPGSVRPSGSGSVVTIEFSQGVTGTASASEWGVGLYGSTGAPHSTVTVDLVSAGASEPSNSVSLGDKATRLVLHMTSSMPSDAHALDVRYDPDPANAARMAGEAPLQASGTPGREDRVRFRDSPSVEGVRFVDPRTVRLSLDRPLDSSGGPLPFVDMGPAAGERFAGFRGAVTPGLSPTLGDTVVEYARGSKEVTLHSSRAAAESAEHHVLIPPPRSGALPHATIQGEGYAGTLMPMAGLVASNADTEGPRILSAHNNAATRTFTIVFTKPLDRDSLDDGVFGVSTAMSPGIDVLDRLAYVPGSLALDLIYRQSLGASTEHTATVHGQVRGENGVAVSGPLSISAAPEAAPAPGIASATFGSPRELTVRLSRPIDPAYAGHVTVSGLGAVAQDYEPRSLEVTLRTENPAVGGSDYTVRLLSGIRDYAGRAFFNTMTGTAISERTVTAPADTSPPAVALVRTVSEPDAIRVLFDEGLSSPPTSGFAVGRVGTSADIAVTATYVAPAEGGPRFDLGLGDHELLVGAWYRVTVPPVSDGANVSGQATVTVEHSRAPAALSAEFTGPNSLRLRVSEPLDPETVGGIAVTGLGRTDVEYERGSTSVILRTSGAPADGMEYEVRVPPSVADAGGTRFSDDGAGGPLRTTVVRVTYGDTGAPAATRAELRTPTTTAVIFDEDVTFADASRPDLRAARWTVSASPGGSLGVGAVEFPAGEHLILSRSASELLQYDSGRTLVLTHEPAPPRSAITVSYEPGGNGGDVTDTASPPNRLGAAPRIPAADATPPSFTARTLTTASTLVEFTRPLGGFTSASEWDVDGEGATRISRVGASAAPEAPRVFVPQGTASITLAHTATEGPGAAPIVEYSSLGPSSLHAGTERLGGLSTLAADGIAPAVVDADFVGRRTVLLMFTEPLDAATVAAGAFSVTAAGSGTNLLAAEGAVTHHAGSPIVLLRLAAGAAQAEHTVTVAATVTDANGVAYAAPASPVTATPPQGTPAEPFTARTASRSQTTVTFDPAVSGMTSASEWTVDGLPATGIVMELLGATSVAQSATLAAGTTSIALSHGALESTGATPAVAYTPGGSPLEAAGTALGAHTAIAADGAGPREASTRTASRTTTEVTFREPVQFRGTEAADRAAKWTVDGAMATSVEIKPGTQYTTITIEHAKTSSSAATPRVSYTATGDGSLEDAAGNNAVYSDGPARDGVEPSAFGRFDPPPLPNMPFRILVWLDEAVRGEGSLPRYLVPVSIDTGRPQYSAMPGLSLAAEDGSDVPVYLIRVNTPSPDDPVDVTTELGTTPKSRLTILLYEEPAAGARYTLTIPPVLTDAAGNAFEYAETLVHGTDTVGPVLERAAFTGSSALYAEFDEPLMASTVAAGSFTVKAEGSEANLLASVGPYAPHSRRVTMALSAAAAEGTTYSVAATPALQDARGNAHVPDDPATATYDMTPPTASRVTFADQYTLEVSISEPLDVETVRSIRAGGPGFGIFDIEYEEGSRTVTLNTLSLGTSGDVDYPEARVVIPATVTDANGVAFKPTTLFTAHGDTMAPVPATALTLSPTSTLVLFGATPDRIRLGDDATQAQRAAHWSVTETRGTAGTSDDTVLAITDAVPASDWRAVLLTHDASSGARADLSVRYVAGADDAGRVRDWATPANVLGSDAAVPTLADGLRPAASSLVLELTHDGMPTDASQPRYANEGDMITATLALDEPSGANTPTIEILGATAGMTALPGGQSTTWTHAAMVPRTGAAQGELAFEIRAWDARGNAATLGPAGLPADRSRIVIDTDAPEFSARTASSGVTVVEFGEPVSGLLVASDWAVAGSPASGASPSPAEPPSPSLLLSGATSAALWHGPLASTADTPDVSYARPPA